MSTTTLTRHVVQQATAAAPLRAVIYTRISADSEGRELGVSVASVEHDAELREMVANATAARRRQHPGLLAPDARASRGEETQ